MDDQLCFVQFLHPGPEHKPDTEDQKYWNTGEHRRKFLHRPGRYIRNGCPVETDIVFRGEWEPQSTVMKRICYPVAGHPRFVYRPYYVVPETGDCFQNTDPFVFGDRFLHICCQQHRRGRPTQLRYLKEGSVLLFGSCLGKQFVLDTVFVVASYEDCMPANAAGVRMLIPPAYEDVTLNRISPNLSYRLYAGASYSDPYRGMYSFFPCRPAVDCPNGFARPRITDPRFITDAHSQSYRLNRQQPLDDVRRLWEVVHDQVTRQHLDIGVYAQVPDGQCSDGSPVTLKPRQDSGTSPFAPGCAGVRMTIPRRGC